MMKNKTKSSTQKQILILLIILTAIMTIITSAISMIVNIKNEGKYLDKNLSNIANTISQTQIVKDNMNGENSESSIFIAYLDTLKESLSNIDVISVVSADNIRKYHSNSKLIGTIYNGTQPDFNAYHYNVYVTSDTGPSGSQRRAYAAIYDENGNYIGFVLAVMLNRNIHRIILNTALIHIIAAVCVILCSILLSKYFSEKIKSVLNGYEPDVFRSMFSVRDNILESLDEGIIAVDTNMQIIYKNSSAKKILMINNDNTNTNSDTIVRILGIDKTMKSGEKISGLSIQFPTGGDVLTDIVPVLENNKKIGVMCILHDRTEYTKIMEDLSGVKHIVECMRANNHDFTNKLHVILGLIQTGNIDEASRYISHITSVQQKEIHNIIKQIEDPSVAALLIGKYARASELNIRFSLKNGSNLKRTDISLPSGDLVTIIGNLLDNAMDSMNDSSCDLKELSIGIFTQPHAMIISVDDTGNGISEKNKTAIFESGFSTKGNGRGIGLNIVKNIVEKYGGTITVDSEINMGTSFTVTLTDGGDKNDV